MILMGFVFDVTRHGLILKLTSVKKSIFAQSMRIVFAVNVSNTHGSTQKLRNVKLHKITVLAITKKEYATDVYLDNLILKIMIA